jgi:hypothetical protein
VQLNHAAQHQLHDLGVGPVDEGDRGNLLDEGDTQHVSHVRADFQDVLVDGPRGLLGPVYVADGQRCAPVRGGGDVEPDQLLLGLLHGLLPGRCPVS